jgi:signal transduction histidine kinase
MRRLYHQLYLTIIASLVLVVLVAGSLWRFAPSETPADQAFEMAGELIATQLPPNGADAAQQQQAIDRLHQRLHMDLALFDDVRHPLAAAGAPLPAPRGRRATGGWQNGRGGPAWAIRLPDGRWVMARPPHLRGRSVLGIVGFLGGIALAVAICAYPVVRRLTGRLERLQAGVESLGSGELSARVNVEGRDEVARLGESFNRAAARIEELVDAHRMLLANTSHELRTPLARIRLGVELLKGEADPVRKRELERDIAELDGLIEQILLLSRLQSVPGAAKHESTDLLALAAEEAARYPGCSVTGEPVSVLGEPALLRRLVRNLIDNAQRHGLAPIEVDVRPAQGQAILTVCDRGPGVAASERERVFLPFQRAAGGRAVDGTGLGLTLVRQIARQHGGDAAWAGSADRPAILRVSIPAMTPQSARTPPVSLGASPTEVKAGPVNRTGSPSSKC